MNRLPNSVLVALTLLGAFASVGVLEACSRQGARAVAEKLAAHDAGAGPPAIVADPAPPPVIVAEKAAPVPAPAPNLALPHEDAQSEIDHLELAGVALVAQNTHAALEQYRMQLAHAEGDASALWGIARTGDAADERLVPLALLTLADASSADPRPLTALARRQIARGEIDDAIATADRAVGRDPASADAHNIRGRALMARGKLAGAIAAFKKATAIDPQHSFAFNNLGFALLQAGKFEDAIDPLETAVSLEPVTAYMWNNLGIAYEKSGRNGDARLAYQRSSEMSPSYVKAKVNLARAANKSDVAAIAPGADAASE